MQIEVSSPLVYVSQPAGSGHFLLNIRNNILIRESDAAIRDCLTGGGKF